MKTYRLEPTMEHKVAALPTTGTLFGVAVVLNYPWEMAQAFLFVSMGSGAEASWRCFVASLGDGLMILLVYTGGWLIFRNVRWFHPWSVPRIAFTAVAGLVIGIAVEWWGLNTGRWQYKPSMPLVPFLDLAVVPLLQMPLLAPLTLWLTDRWLDRQST